MTYTMNAPIIIADCLPGYHHPPGHPELCIPDTPPTPVPTLDGSALLGIALVVLVTGGIALWRGQR